MEEKQIINQLHELSRTKRNELYSNFKDRFSTNLGEKIENNPFIGYVGEKYLNSSDKPGLCFVAKAGAESKPCSEDGDRAMNDSFVAFIESKPEERINTYWSYQEVVKNNMKEWNGFKILAYLFSKIDQNIDNISYINIVPFRYRYKGSEPTKEIYKIAWENFTNKLLDILNPDFIIPLGKDLHNEIRQNYPGDAKKVTEGIRRTNGDNYLHAEAKQQMDEMALMIKKGR